MLDNSLTTNQLTTEFSVTEISQKIKILLESNLKYVRVKGEISGLKVASSGHGYFNLKDHSAVIAVTCWKVSLAAVQFSLVDGIEVSITGRITAYPGGSRYQLSAEKIEAAGVGAWITILNERRQRLEKEGLFDQINKQALPFLPAIIGVVTSITGAVIRDIIHRIIDRCPARVIIWPVAVQGEQAASQIAEAVAGFNQLAADMRPEIIIVARGGGSAEDLWPFNEEIVVRSVAASLVPVISAVGHETDYTLIDLVADLRAPTPTAAVEFAVPVVSNLKYVINSHYNRLVANLFRLLAYKQQVITAHHRIFISPAYYLESLAQKLDESWFQLLESWQNFLRHHTAQCCNVTTERLTPKKVIDYKLLQLTYQKNYLNKLVGLVVAKLENQVTASSKLLASLDYHRVLKRGFALIKTIDGRPLPSKIAANLHSSFKVQFADGELVATRSAEDS